MELREFGFTTDKTWDLRLEAWGLEGGASP
jgi:hypothetical protein